MPWQEGHEFRRRLPRDRAEWRHVVYLDVYDLALAVAELEKHFGREPDSSGESTPGQACLAALMVTAAGRPLVDSYTLSSLAWSLGRTRRPGPGSPDWLEGFDDAVEAARDAFATRMALDPDDEEGQRLQGLGFKVGSRLAVQCVEARAPGSHVDGAVGVVRNDYVEHGETLQAVVHRLSATRGVVGDEDAAVGQGVEGGGDVPP